MPEITSLMALVERILQHLEQGTLEAGFKEAVHRGSASGFAGVVRQSEGPEGLVLVVRLSIMRLPTERREELLTRLLGLNHDFLGRASFSVSDGTVYLTAGRPVEDLDPGEIIDLILWTSEQADLFDDVLLSEFGRGHAL